MFETWLHPTKFCTVMCTEGTACKRKVCWFAHTPSELRAPTPHSARPLAMPGPALDTAGPYSSLQQGAQSPPGVYGAAATNGVGPMLRARRASYSGMASTSMGGGNVSSSAATSLYGSAANSSSSSSCGSASTSRRNSSYYMRKDTGSPLAASPLSHLVVGDGMLTQLQHGSSLLAQHSPASVPLLADLQAVGAGTGCAALSSLPGPVAAMSPSERFVRQLQQLQQQQELAGLQQNPGLHMPGTASPLRGLGGLSDSAAAAVPVSIMPMLASTAASDSLVLDTAPLNPLTGLLTSLEEQAWQAQLQAANAQAAAAAASSNLQAVLSALGGLSVHGPGGMCGSPQMDAVLAAQQGYMPSASAAGRGFQYGMM